MYLHVLLRLPAQANVTKMVSTLSADGILTVEAPVPERSVPALTIIPIKVVLWPFCCQIFLRMTFADIY